MDPATFHYIQQQPVSPFYLFQSLTLGLQNAAEIISFLFIIGGMFAIMDATGAINAGLSQRGGKDEGPGAADDPGGYGAFQPAVRFRRLL